MGCVVEMGERSVYGPEVDLAHRSGDLQINESDQLKGYWASWSYQTLLNKSSIPEKNMKSLENSTNALNEISSFLNRVEAEWSGFQRIIGIDHYLMETATINEASFDKGFERIIPKIIDEMKYQKINFHLFLGFLDEMVLGSPSEETDNSLRVRESLFKSFISNEGCSPIITPIVQLKDLDWGNEYNRAIFEAAAKYGIPFFMSGSKIEMDGKLRINDPWIEGCSSEVNTGVLGLVTINLPRIAYQTKDESAFFERVDENMDMARDGLERKRAHMSARMENGEMPFTKAASGSLDGYFDAMGIVGVHETLLNLFGKGIESMQGKAVAYKLLEHMNTKMKEYQEETGHPFCLTAIASGNAPYKLAEMDRSDYPDIKTSGVEAPYYTNSSSLPVDYTEDLWDALEHQKKIQTLYNGGTLFNIYLDKEIDDVNGCMALTKKIDERFQIPCFAFSPTYHMDQRALHSYRSKNSSITYKS